MYNICRGCGAYEPKRMFAKEDGQTSMICTLCETVDYVIQKPLLVISGATGTGKTTIAQQLVGVLQGVFILEIDILWNPYFHQEFESTKSVNKFLNHWLRVTKNIHYNGLQAVAFGSATPDQILLQTELKHFPEFHFLAFTSEPEVIHDRLAASPVWKESWTDEFVNNMLEFNDILDNYIPKSPKITSYTRLKTGNLSINETIDEVIRWIERYGKPAIATQP